MPYFTKLEDWSLTIPYLRHSLGGDGLTPLLRYEQRVLQPQFGIRLEKNFFKELFVRISYPYKTKSAKLAKI